MTRGCQPPRHVPRKYLGSSRCDLSRVCRFTPSPLGLRYTANLSASDGSMVRTRSLHYTCECSHRCISLTAVCGRVVLGMVSGDWACGGVWGRWRRTGMCCAGRDGALSPCSHVLTVVSCRSGGGGLRTPALAGVRAVSHSLSRASRIIADVYYMPSRRARDPASSSPRSRWWCLRSSTLGSPYVYWVWIDFCASTPLFSSIASSIYSSVSLSLASFYLFLSLVHRSAGRGGRREGSWPAPLASLLAT